MSAIFGAVARLSVPPSAKKDAVIEVRVLIQHVMESGFRRDAQGRAIPMNVITEVVARYAGQIVFRAELGSGIAANPYLSFFIVATESADVQVEWVDTQGMRGDIRAALNVV